MRNFIICFHHTQWEAFFQTKFHPGMKLHSFHSGTKLTCKQKSFHPETSFIPGWDFISVTRVFTREISSRDKIIPVYGEMSLTVYTFLPRWNFIPDEKKKNKRVNTSSRDEILKWACFFNFWRIIQVCFPNSACLNTMKVWI